MARYIRPSNSTLEIFSQINASDDKQPMAIVSNGTRQDRPVEIIGHLALKARQIRIPVTITRELLLLFRSCQLQNVKTIDRQSNKLPRAQSPGNADVGEIRQHDTQLTANDADGSARFRWQSFSDGSTGHAWQSLTVTVATSVLSLIARATPFRHSSALQRPKPLLATQTQRL